MKIKKFLMFIGICVFCIVFNTDKVYAGGGYSNLGNNITYRVDSIEILNGKLDIKGWAYQQSKTFHYTTKGSGYNNHNYTLKILGVTYKDKGDYFIDHTDLNKSLDTTQTVISYSNVGFHFEVDIDDIIASGNNKITLDLNVYHHNRSTEQISLSYMNTISSLEKDGYKVTFDTTSNPVSIYTDIYNLLVNSGGYKSASALKDSSGRYLYYTIGTSFSMENNTMTGNIKYDSSNGSYWYEILFKESSFDGTRMRVVPSASGTKGWICDAHVMYTGDPTVINLERSTFNIKYETFSDDVFLTQVKTKGNELILYDKIPNKKGYQFLYWNTKADGLGDTYNPSDVYINDNDAILYAIYHNSIPEIDGPILKDDALQEYDIPPILEGEDVVIQLGDKFNPLDFVVASDEEDGDISNDIIVTNNSISYDNQNNTNKPGKFEVTVSVSDSGGYTVSKKFVVIVNDAPVIEASERWFVEGWTVDKTNLLSKVTAHDLEDGDISSKIDIISIEYSNGNIEYNPLFFNTQLNDNALTDVAIITYSVTDNYNKTTFCSVNLNIYRDYAQYDDGLSLRYISLQYIDTLDEDSVWINNETYQTKLIDSLNKTKNEALYHFEISKLKIEENKDWLVSNVPSTYSNQQFYELLNNGELDENDS